MIHRPPRHPALRPLVTTLWATSGGGGSAGREWVLPTGSMHLAIRLDGPGLRLFEHAEDGIGRVVGTAVIGGARDCAYLRDVSSPPPAVGAQLAPGAARLLLGIPADSLAGQHTDLEAAWGRTVVERIREQLLEAGSLAGRLDRFEELLAARISAGLEVPPLAAWAIEGISSGRTIGMLVGESGRSHRHLLSLFRREMGLAPTVYCRLLRLQRAVHLLAPGGPSLAEVAIAAGFSDQPHLTREFHALAGTTPALYRAAGPLHANHLPLVKSDPFKTRR